MLAGARSLYGIAPWGRAQPPEVVRALGFPRARTPAVATLHYTFKALDVAAFEQALQHWATQVAPAQRGTARASLVRQGWGRQAQALAPLALDGKGLRGIHGEELPGVRLVALYDVQAGLVLAQTGGQDQDS